jgi:antitoxin component YwqK of YwqJK toxin-antitoxin module
MSIKFLTAYHPNGQKKSEGNWDGDVPVGNHFTWHENGNKEYEMVEVNDSMEMTTSWYENGQMESKGATSPTHYQEVGLWTQWFENGNKKSEGFYKGEDGRDSEWKFWHSNGQLACSGVFKGYRGDGLWAFFDKDGKKIHKREYRENELLDVWKNLRVDGCSDELVDIFKEYIFRDAK